MASIGGFLVANALASQVEDRDERARIGLVGAFMPSPLVGAIVASGMAHSEGRGTEGALVTRSRGGRVSRRPSGHAARPDELERLAVRLDDAIRAAAVNDPQLARALESFDEAIEPADDRSEAERRAHAITDIIAGAGTRTADAVSRVVDALAAKLTAEAEAAGSESNGAPK